MAPQRIASSQFNYKSLIWFSTSESDISINPNLEGAIGGIETDKVEGKSQTLTSEADTLLKAAQQSDSNVSVVQTSPSYTDAKEIDIQAVVSQLDSILPVPSKSDFQNFVENKVKGPVKALERQNQKKSKI